MSASKIENEILEVVKVKAKKGEDRQEYLDRLMRAVTKLSDDVWEGLSTEAQEWTNAAAQSAKDKTDIEDFADLTPPEEQEEDEAETEVEAAPKRRTTNNGSRKISACHKIKTFVVKNPKITIEDLSAKLKDAGLKVSDVTIATIRSDTRDTLRVLNDAKMIAVEL